MPRSPRPFFGSPTTPRFRLGSSSLRTRISRPWHHMVASPPGRDLGRRSRAEGARCQRDPRADVVAAPRHAPRRRRARRHELMHSPHRRTPRDRVLRFSIGEAFRALPLEAHFASMRSRVCVAIAHRHAPDHFDVVLAVAAMLFAVLRQCAAKAGCIVSALSNGCGHRELDSPLSQCSAERDFQV